MKKENHNEEIKATRVGGFGGSDAAMVAIRFRRRAFFKEIKSITL